MEVNPRIQSAHLRVHLFALVFDASGAGSNHAIRGPTPAGSALFSVKHSKDNGLYRAVRSVHKVQNQIH
jgi:hypothetical protein